MINTFLINDFYNVISKTQKDEQSFLIEIQLNAEHLIFKGHFEQMPVVPGVCQTQIIKELLQQVLNKNLILFKGTNIKFTGMIVPTQHPKVLVEISYKLIEENYIVDAKLFFETIIFTKFKGEFKIK